MLFKRQVFLFLFLFSLLSCFSQVVINEVCAINGNGIEDEDGDNSDWIELYNKGSFPINLLNYSLSDRSGERKFVFPSIAVSPDSFILIFASAKNKFLPKLHSNFKISEGETIYLFNESGKVEDSFLLNETQLDHSLGRYPDGSSSKYIYTNPSPGSSNALTAFQLYTSAPAFSVKQNFLSTSQSIAITSNSPNAKLFYTLNGTVPDINSQLYTYPVSISKTTVIRAIAVSSGNLPSKISSKTYFINFETRLPVFSIYTDSLNLYDWNTGILVSGPNASLNYPYHGSNFWENSEKPVHVELYNKNKQMAFEQDMGIKVHGGSVNRSKPMKSLRMLAKKKYGKGRVDYPLISHKPISSYKKFVLRNGSSDFCKSMFRDDMIHRMLYLKTYNDILGYEPAVVFLNGKYYGIENIREKRGKHYLNENYGISTDSVDILREENIVLEGDSFAFSQLYHYSVQRDLALDSNYAIVGKQLDLLNFADYFITETFFNNNDWPYNNLEYWRPKKPDGKFRYAIFDLDVALGGFLYAPYTNDELGIVLGPYGDTCKHVQILKSLLKNTVFRNYFINRYCDLVNTLFSTENFKNEIEKTKAQISFDIPQHFAAWGYQTNNWNADIDTNLIPSVENRPTYALNQLQNNLQPGTQVRLNLEVVPPNGGSINLNSIEPEKFPWNGIYFSDIPVNLKANANVNYQFMGWGSEAVKLNSPESSEIKLKLSETSNLTAYFKLISQNNLTLFPNPSKDKVEILAFLPAAGGSEVLVITDASGKAISSEKFSEIEIFHYKKDISTLKSGNYILSISGNNFSFKEKLSVIK